MDKAIILVSFGTSDLSGIKKSIENIEKNIKNYFIEYDVIKAFTSQIIINKLKNNNFEIRNLEEVLEGLKELNYEEVIIQPLHIISGKEYYKIENIYSKFKDKFEILKLGKPLFYLENGMAREKDFELFMNFIEDTIKEEENALFFGHGSNNESDVLYWEFYKYLRKKGYSNIFVGTIEGSLSIDNVILILKEKNISKISLVPLMISLGFHMKNDIMSSEENSWKSKLEKSNIKVQSELRALGEYDGFSKIYFDKINLLKNE